MASQKLPSHKKLLVAAIALSIGYAANATAAASERPEEMVVTSVRMSEALVVETDPRKPRQPLPAHDGADFLKTIPGFSVVRKGGADGDPLFRGMAGSRLSLLVDGATVLGGCGHRMDPPTAYIFPEAFERIEVIKGPQSVQHGPGNAAGLVKFERNRSRVAEPQWNVHSSFLGGSFSRHDEVLDVGYRTPEFSLRGIATNAEQRNYRDGDNVKVHSAYHRWSADVTGAWTPTDDVFVELSAGRSDGEAAYADRAMDGSLFEREHYSMKAELTRLSPLLTKLESQLYYQYIDHVMDNYSLRSVAPGTMMSAMNPDRLTWGGKLATTLQVSPDVSVVVGTDLQRNEHTNRSSMNVIMMDYRQLAREADAEFSQAGVFVEGSWDVSDTGTVKAGVRADRWTARDRRDEVVVGHHMTVSNPTTNQKRNETLYSGFARYEWQPAMSGVSYYVGIGHNERFPDYWELISKEGLDSNSAFSDVGAERLTQLDAGLIYNYASWHGSVSLFYNEIKDYILIDTTIAKPGMMGQRHATVARNIDARSWGAEADITYRFAEHWRAELTLASVRGANKTDDITLAQLPPLEGRLGAHYDNGRWSLGTLVRYIDDQQRVDIGRGNIAGQDIGPTSSAAVLSLNAGWQATEQIMVTAGLDNALDKLYAEHISRSGADIAGYTQTTRVNEPGRTLWMKAQLTF